MFAIGVAEVYADGLEYTGREVVEAVVELVYATGLLDAGLLLAGLL